MVAGIGRNPGKIMTNYIKTKLGLLCFCSAILMLLCAVPTSAADGMRELYRIRVVNAVGGPIQVSADGGLTYSNLGRVRVAATMSIEGFAASVYADPGKVAATAVHGIRIKVAGSKGCAPVDSKIISIIPSEFASTPKGFGGHIAGSSGIYTDIPTGEGIFRNLAPFVSNPVFLDLGNRLAALPAGYVPSVGDVLLIVVQIPVKYPEQIVIENRAGGSVQAVYKDGSEVVAKVESPVTGVGRFDATGYTGTGRINTNHTGVITIATAPIAHGARDGSGIETRGGIMIQPSRHSRNVPHGGEVLVVAPAKDGDAWLEGAPPLFCGYIGLADDSSNSFYVDVKTSSSDWISLPPLVGRAEDALTKLPGGLGSVSHIRIKFPDLNERWVRAELDGYSRKVYEAKKADAEKKGTIVKANISIRLDTADSANTEFASYYLDGEFKGISNNPPYSFQINTTELSAGEHMAEIRATDSQGTVVQHTTKSFFVQRHDQRAESSLKLL